MDEPNELGQPRSETTSEISTEEVLAEVERRRSEARRLASQSRVTILADRLAFWLTRHWLAVCNTFAFLYVGLPILAAVLMYLGAEWPATVIYTIYRPLCHQLPQRSFFLFGPQLTYSVTELVELSGTTIDLGMTTRAFVGNQAVGYKVGLCQRDLAIYGMILLFGLAYGPLRRRWKVSALPVWAYVVFGVVPMLFDGGYQFISYIVPLFWPDGPITPHETTPVMRVITGGLFGLGTVWLAYPLVQETMEEMRESLQRRFGWG
jgi:uncharacterized membrane protein